MRKLDVMLLFPEEHEVTMCYRMGLKSIQIDGAPYPVFSVCADRKNIFLERLKDEFGSDVVIEDLSKEFVTKKGSIIDIMYSKFIQGESYAKADNNS